MNSEKDHYLFPFKAIPKLQRMRDVFLGRGDFDPPGPLLVCGSGPGQVCSRVPGPAGLQSWVNNSNTSVLCRNLQTNPLLSRKKVRKLSYLENELSDFNIQCYSFLKKKNKE